MNTQTHVAIRTTEGVTELSLNVIRANMRRVIRKAQRRFITSTRLDTRIVRCNPSHRASNKNFPRFMNARDARLNTK